MGTVKCTAFVVGLCRRTPRESVEGCPGCHRLRLLERFILVSCLPPSPHPFRPHYLNKTLFPERAFLAGKRPAAMSTDLTQPALILLIKPGKHWLVAGGGGRLCSILFPGTKKQFNTGESNLGFERWWQSRNGEHINVHLSLFHFLPYSPIISLCLLHVKVLFSFPSPHSKHIHRLSL